ncbi:MAG: prenyltransferase/squalene oxidase repeat-containing protein [Lentisphaeria bacterium]|nr:prenyltransferase/squalene oxidase repeat-containing protein [Lentisphaeria bacterium]
MTKYFFYVLVAFHILCPGLAGEENNNPPQIDEEDLTPEVPDLRVLTPEQEHHRKVYAMPVNALRWLKANQEGNGSWSPKQNPEAMTALAVLAFLSQGETPASEAYGETVRKAIQWLAIDMQRNHGKLANDDFTHAVSTWALAEAYSLIRIPFIKPATEAGVKTIIKGQQKGGGFAKGYAQEAAWDLNFSAWNMMALKAAYVAGSETPGLEEAMEKAAQFLLVTANTDGLFRQTPFADGDVLSTAQGTFLLILLGQGKSKQSHQAKAIIQSYKPLWEKGTSLPAANRLYFMDQARFHSGRKTYKDWWPLFSQMKLDHQYADGHWESPAGDVYSGKPADPYYTTALMVLAIPPIRNLPTYKVSEERRQIENKDVFNLKDEEF